MFYMAVLKNPLIISPHIHKMPISTQYTIYAAVEADFQDISS